jgi:hypothetical protein
MHLTPPAGGHRKRTCLRLSIWVVAFTCLATALPAQQLEWVRQFGDGVSPDVWVADVKVADGFVYAGGTIASTSVIDGFVRKLDLDGNLIWHRQFGTSAFDEVTVLRVEGSQVFVGGVTTGTFPGYTDTTPFFPDLFVRTYDTDGNVVGTIQVPRLSTSFAGTPNAAFIDASGVYGTDSVGADFFDQDVLVFKYDLAGNLLWSVQIGTAAHEQVGSSWPRSLSVDAGGVFVAGSTQGAFPGQTLTGYEDAFLARLDTGGNLMWVRQTGIADGFAWGSGVVAEGSGVYFSSMSMTFFTPAVLAVARYDAAGALTWTREVDAAFDDVLFAGIAANAAGVAVGGAKDGSFPGFTSAGLKDAFVRSYDSLGNEQWTVQLGSPSVDEVYAVTLAGGATYLGGVARGTLPTQTGPNGAFVAKISPPAALDSDSDGLSDSDELARGTNPLVPDTDSDGSLDGAEVALAGGGSCPSPLDPDSDDDGLADGVEIGTMGTSPCLADTDGDGVSDALDPQPLVAGLTLDVVEQMLLDFAGLTQGLPVSSFAGPNANARAAKRIALANRFRDAALIADSGDLPGTVLALEGILKKIDGVNPNDDWLVGSSDQADMAAAVAVLIQLLGG